MHAQYTILDVVSCTLWQYASTVVTRLEYSDVVSPVVLLGQKLEFFHILNGNSYRLWSIQTWTQIAGLCLITSATKRKEFIRIPCMF